MMHCSNRLGKLSLSMVPANRLFKKSIGGSHQYLHLLYKQESSAAGINMRHGKDMQHRMSQMVQTKLFSTSNDVNQANDILNVNLIDYNTVSTDDKIEFGEYATIIASNDPNIVRRQFTDIKSINKSTAQENSSNLVWIRGRVNVVRAKGNVCFVILRSNTFYSIQCVHFKDKQNAEISKQMIKFVGGEVTLESIVDILGVVVPADVKSCSQSDVEIQIKKIFIASKAPAALPFSLDDAGRSQDEIEKSMSSEKPFSNIPQVLQPYIVCHRLIGDDCTL